MEIPRAEGLLLVRRIKGERSSLQLGAWPLRMHPGGTLAHLYRGPPDLSSMILESTQSELIADLE
jgi:hypothetical protein